MTRSGRLFKSCWLADFAVLVAILICATSLLSGQTAATSSRNNLAAAWRNRPPEVPGWYLITPFGYFHPSCVLSLAEEELVLADGRLQHANGRVEANVPVCNYPRYSPSGLLVTAGAAKVSVREEPTVRGWLEYVSATTSTSYGKISATWTVPPQPSTDNYQTIFFFPGLEDINNTESIVQPVLQWYAPGPWAIASWNCCIQGITWESIPVKVKPGDTILGTISSACKPATEPCPLWKVLTEDETTGKKTVLRKTPSQGQVWNWGFGAVLEVYGVTQCSDYPANSSVVFNVTLYNKNLKVIPHPGWTGTPAGSDITPQCNYGLKVTPTEETLQY